MWVKLVQILGVAAAVSFFISLTRFVIVFWPLDMFKTQTPTLGDGFLVLAMIIFVLPFLIAYILTGVTSTLWIANQEKKPALLAHKCWRYLYYINIGCVGLVALVMVLPVTLLSFVSAFLS